MFVSRYARVKKFVEIKSWRFEFNSWHRAFQTNKRIYLNTLPVKLFVWSEKVSTLPFFFLGKSEKHVMGHRRIYLFWPKHDSCFVMVLFMFSHGSLHVFSCYDRMFLMLFSCFHMFSHVLQKYTKQRVIECLISPDIGIPN